MSNYNALVYEGPAISFTVQEFATRVDIELIRDKPKILKRGIRRDEIAYYSRMRRMNIRMLQVGPVEKKEGTTVPRMIKSEPDISEKLLEEMNSLEVPEIKLADLSEKEVTETDASSDESIEVESGLEAELSEYLDINYSDEDLIALAEKLGTKGIRSNSKKSTIIDKMIDGSYDEVYRLLVDKL